MDPLSNVISFLQLRSYRVGGFEAGGDRAVEFGGYEAIKCYAVMQGACWIAVDGEQPRRLQQGDCVLLPQGRPFRIGSDLTATAVDWRQHFLDSGEGTVVRLNHKTGTKMLGSHFHLAGWQADLLLGVLPALVHLSSERDHEKLRWVFDRLEIELTDVEPGGILIAQQLACMAFVQVLRLYLKESHGLGWLFALSDKHVGAAIAAMHKDPARRWTVAELANEVGMSRSRFAAHFSRLVGEGPVEYLTRWRMLLAGRSLAQGETVAAIARALGYESDSAFRTAFRRVTGTTPRDHGRAAELSQRTDDLASLRLMPAQ